MLATPTTSSTTNRPFQCQPPLTPIFSSPPAPAPAPPSLSTSSTSTYHAYVPLIPSPLSPRSVRRKGSRGVSSQQQQQWRNLRHQSLSSPPRKPLQEEIKWRLHDNRPLRNIRIGDGNGSQESFVPESGPGFGISSSLATDFPPLPSPSPSPLSSPLSQSPSSSLFSWEMDTGRVASAGEIGGGGGENLGSITATTAAVAQPQQRVYRPNPLLRSRDAVAKRRRDMFLNKVRLGRDECRWGDRGDQILRLDFVADKKRWEAELARTAPEVPPEADYQYKDEMDMCRQKDVSHFLRSDQHQGKQQPKPQYPDNFDSSNPNFNRSDNIHPRFTSLFRHPSLEDQEREEAERVAQRERQELEALVALMEDDGQQQQQQQALQRGPSRQEQPSKIDDIDEEDLDGLLMGYASSKDLWKSSSMGVLPPSQVQGHGEDGDEMDTSMG